MRHDAYSMALLYTLAKQLDEPRNNPDCRRNHFPWMATRNKC